MSSSSSSVFKPITQPPCDTSVSVSVSYQSSITTRPNSALASTTPSSSSISIIPSSKDNNINNIVNSNDFRRHSGLEIYNNSNSREFYNNNNNNHPFLSLRKTSESDSDFDLRTSNKDNFKDFKDSSDRHYNTTVSPSSQYHYSRTEAEQQRKNSDTSNNSNNSNNISKNNILLRRPSSAMRVRELRENLTNMTSPSAADDGSNELNVSGSQKARLLVASQQCLVSRLQDLRNEMESFDNEVSRIRQDIINSRRYFSAMTGIDRGPAWPKMRNNPNQQSVESDSAYTSPKCSTPTSSIATELSSESSDISIEQEQRRKDSSSASTSYSSSFNQLQQFDDNYYNQPSSLKFMRSDSLSSIKSWKSEVEMEGFFSNHHSSTNNT